ncbi:unnamed protein product [Moneuplotes crassus]|uniref:Uncharacterized protein n=1 Tax=Euplotes crassus TaxID=5936 RepID=A0AAD2CW70_EUPCR|nr:unnamed protein product [Moneuplotes crassus]
MHLAYVGLGITGIGCACAAIGWALQKQAFNLIHNSEKSVFKSIHWWIGLAFIILTQPFYLVGISMVNQSTIGVVGPFSLVANMLLAKFYLKEPIRKCEYIGLTCFVFGCIITLMYASMENNRYSQEKFNEYFFSTVSMTYLFVNLLLIMVGLVASDYIIQANPTEINSLNEKELDEIIPEIVNTEEGEEEEDLEDRTIEVADDNHIRSQVDSKSDTVEYAIRHRSPEKNSFILSLFTSKRWRIVPLLLYPYTGCFCTSLTMTLSRGLSGMALADGEETNSKFAGIMPKMYLFGIVFNSVLSYYMLNKALKNFNTVYVSPLFKAGDLFHNLLSGGIFLREFGEYESWFDFSYFLGGIIICIISISLLLLGNDNLEAHKDKER